MTRLQPVHDRPWRCTGCWARHTPLAILCPYTRIPRDLR